MNSVYFISVILSLWVPWSYARKYNEIIIIKWMHIFQKEFLMTSFPTTVILLQTNNTLSDIYIRNSNPYFKKHLEFVL